MNEAARTMLERYPCRSTRDYENALKEVIQEIALLGLWRAKFFERAAFYGGSALRILYGLDRFSEDLDFSLLRRDSRFSLEGYVRAVEDELRSFGMSARVESRDKNKESSIESAFIKAGTLKNLITVPVPEETRRKVHKGKIVKVKLEVDTDPPGGFQTESRFHLRPIPFSVNTYQLPFLFAGKMHALLCRPWLSRVKGRDWYDLIWYVSRGTPLNLAHLELRMRQSGHLKARETLSAEKLRDLLQTKIASIDWASAREDAIPLLRDPAATDVWSKEFFRDVAERVLI